MTTPSSLPHNTRRPNSMDELTKEQLEELRSFIYDQKLHTSQPLPMLSIDLTLFIYGQHYDLKAMYNFLTYSKNENLDDGYILATIMHDLNGRNADPLTFAPRTSSYKDEDK
jgi:hypothetical protein